jgi:hypothetical protein
MKWLSLKSPRHEFGRGGRSNDQWLVRLRPAGCKEPSDDGRVFVKSPASLKDLE